MGTLNVIQWFLLWGRGAFCQKWIRTQYIYCVWIRICRDIPPLNNKKKKANFHCLHCML